MVLQGLVCVHSGVASLSFRSGPEQRSTGLGGIRGKSPQPLRILNALGREGQRMAATERAPRTGSREPGNCVP